MAHYLRVWFWLDLVATFPFDYITNLTASSFGNRKYTRILKLVRLIRLLRVFRLTRILNRLKWWASIRFAVRKIIRFIIMITVSKLLSLPAQAQVSHHHATETLSKLLSPVSGCTSSTQQHFIGDIARGLPSGFHLAILEIHRPFVLVFGRLSPTGMHAYGDLWLELMTGKEVGLGIMECLPARKGAVST